MCQSPALEGSCPYLEQRENQGWGRSGVGRWIWLYKWAGASLTGLSYDLGGKHLQDHKAGM